MIKAVIFDLDGVIVSTDRFHFEAWKKLADSLDIDFDEKLNSRLKGVGRMESLSIILEEGGLSVRDTEKEALADEKNDTYKRLLAQMTPTDVSNEVRSTLEMLKKRGLMLAIGSSSKNAKYILERVGLINEFDAISDGTNIIRSKPDPEVFIKAAEMLGVEPDDVLVVEDARSGIDAAVAGGFRCAGISDAASYKKTTFPIRRFSDLLTIDL